MGVIVSSDSIDCMKNRQIQSLKTIVKKYIRLFLYSFPIQKGKVVFLNFNGRGFGDNPKYIAEEILRQKLPWRMIWLTRDNFCVPPYMKSVRIGGFAAYYELATSQFIISNCKNNIPSYYISKKKEKQYYLQTWHGDFALKYIEKEIENTLSPDYLTASKIDSMATNAILSGNPYFSTILKESFWLPAKCEILEYGVPRNDVYFRGEGLKNQIKRQYGFSDNDRILLYAPTFRDDYTFDCDIDFERLRESLSQLSDASWRIIIRLHPNISSFASKFCFNEDIIDGSAYSDQQELCLISDCLITDYSSIMGDFLLMRKPVFLYATDLEEYSNNLTGRGLRELYYHLPFSFSRNQSELESHISDFDGREYSKRINTFMQEYYCSFDDGHASERVVNHLKSVL